MAWFEYSSSQPARFGFTVAVERCQSCPPRHCLRLGKRRDRPAPQTARFGVAITAGWVFGRSERMTGAAPERLAGHLANEFPAAGCDVFLAPRLRRATGGCPPAFLID